MSTTDEARPARIRTPDQRLRVFVSSTLQELAPERKAARRAIERLSAAPVMFELGARPHPPRSLYRAYLEQSDIFVGIYWQKYGWVAPGETVSGLEDEYNLAPAGMPKLMYFKETDGARDPGLVKLLDRIRNDDTASYKHFRDARELARLLVTDLAVLLAERFDDSRSFTAAPAPLVENADAREAAVAALPAPLTMLFGREQDIERLAALVRSPGIRLVTLTGPGGIGKTRLAIETARAVAAAVGEVAFVPLAPVDAPEQVPRAIAQALGVRDSGDAPLELKLARSLSGRRMLMVLDNFEQVVDAAPLLSTLLAAAPDLKALVTSRALLKIAGEHSYEVGALELPAERFRQWDQEDRLAPSVELFIERSRSVKPDLELTAENVEAIERIVTRLEGVPLAIELGAARTRLLAPPTLLERLHHQLPVLVGGQRDAPKRQKAVRDTIEWSTRLLRDDERTLLWRLGVFAGRFSLDSVQAVADPGTDVLALMEGLVDASLVRQQDREGRTYFQLLATVREYALEHLDAAGLRNRIEAEHAQYFVGWAQELAPDFIGPKQHQTMSLLSDQLDNLRAAARHLLDARDWETLSRFTLALFAYWLISGTIGEVGGWMREMLSADDRLDDHARAVGLLYGTFTRLFEEKQRPAVDGVSESVELFRRTGDPLGEAIGLWALGDAYLLSQPPRLREARSTTAAAVERMRALGLAFGESFTLMDLARIDLVENDFPRASEGFRAALEAAQRAGDDATIALALNQLGWSELFAGNTETAASLFLRQLDIAITIESSMVLAFALESFEGLAGMLGDVEPAGHIGGAARAIEERAGLFIPFSGVLQQRVESRIRSSERGEDFESAFAEGRHLSIDEAIALSRRVAAAAGAAGSAQHESR